MPRNHQLVTARQDGYAYRPPQPEVQIGWLLYWSLRASPVVPCFAMFCPGRKGLASSPSASVCCSPCLSNLDLVAPIFPLVLLSVRSHRVLAWPTTYLVAWSGAGGLDAIRRQRGLSSCAPLRRWELQRRSTCQVLVEDRDGVHSYREAQE